MNQRERDLKELQFLRETVEEIGECINRSLTTEDGDMLMPETDATRMLMLVGNC